MEYISLLKQSLFNLLTLKKCLNCAIGEGTGSENKDKSKNEISSFQAFCIGTASRVGTGNLAGVASAML